MSGAGYREVFICSPDCIEVTVSYSRPVDRSLVGGVRSNENVAESFDLAIK